MKIRDGETRPGMQRFIAMVLAAVLVFGLAGCGGGGGGTGSTSPTVSLGGSGDATTTSAGGTGVTPTTVSPTNPGQVNPNVSANAVGTEVCAQCHTGFPNANGYMAGDATDSNPASNTFYDAAAGGSIYNNYINSVHFTPAAGKTASASSGYTDFVKCEGCHGPGSQHYGVGPIAYYAPGVNQCQECHAGTGPAISQTAVVDAAGFNASSHANPNSVPDKFFFQGDYGTAQASLNGALEWKDANGSIPVSKNEHIEECSVCHNPDASATHIAKGDVSNPQVGCSSCHDPHRPADKTRNYVTTRDGSEVGPDQQPNFKPYKVNNNQLGVQFGAINTAGGQWIRPRLHYAYKVGGDPNASYSGYANQATVGDWLRLSSERLCAACHTKGQYKYGVRAGNNLLTSTHQSDVYTQFTHSLHASYTQAAWKDFSLLAETPDHRPQYPIDMGGKAGQNGTTVPFDGRMNGGADNFACYQCHHGIATIDYLEGVQGGNALGDSNQAHVLWGDTTVTCITCHDPHKSDLGATRNIRVPKYLSFNPEFRPDNNGTGTGNVRGGSNTFLDLTPIPTNVGNNVICLFCHQGRESGWTAWNKVRRNRIAQGDSPAVAAAFWYNNPTTVINAKGFNFVNDHYLAAGSQLYGRNSTEFAGQTYSDGIPKHQEQGCVGCHMSNPDTNATRGGHTFVPQIQNCQQCHAGAQNFHDIMASGDWNGNNIRQTAFDELGTLQVIPAKDRGGPGHATPVYGTGIGGTGLFGLLNEALWDANIEYDPSAYPYFYKADSTRTAANAFKAFTPYTLAAAQNLQQLYRSGAPGQQAVYVHNPFYGAQIMIDSLSVLGKTKGANGTTNFDRPTGALGGTTHAGRDYRTLSVP